MYLLLDLSLSMFFLRTLFKALRPLPMQSILLILRRSKAWKKLKDFALLS